MKMMKLTIYVSLIVLTSSVYAVGTWDKGETILGLNPNGDFVAGDEVRIKKASTGTSGCEVVKFKPGFGNIPNDPNGIATRDRIYSTALAAFLAGKKVSIWVYDVPNCYGLMLTIGDTNPF